METLEHILKNTSEETPIPDALHARIMKRVRTARLRTARMLLLPLFSLILVFSGWHMWNTFISTDAYIVVQDMMQNEFEITTQFFTDALDTVQTIGSPLVIAIFIISFFSIPMTFFLPYYGYALKKRSKEGGIYSLNHGI